MSVSRLLGEGQVAAAEIVQQTNRTARAPAFLESTTTTPSPRIAMPQIRRIAEKYKGAAGTCALAFRGPFTAYTPEHEVFEQGEGGPNINRQLKLRRTCDSPALSTVTSGSGPLVRGNTSIQGPPTILGPFPVENWGEVPGYIRHVNGTSETPPRQNLNWELSPGWETTLAPLLDRLTPEQRNPNAS